MATRKKRTFKQFEIEFQTRLIEKRTFFIEHSLLIFERKKLQLEFKSKLTMNDFEKEQLLQSERMLSHNLLNQPGVLSIVSIFKQDNENILEEIKALGEDTINLIYELEFASLRAMEDADVDVDSIMDETLKIEMKEMDIVVVDILAQKQYYDYLVKELEKFNESLNYVEIQEAVEDNSDLETTHYDSSLVKWNRLIGDFYFLIDAMEHANIISYKNKNKNRATEQLANCFGIELASSWSSSRNSDYNKEISDFLDFGKTSIFSDMRSAFGRNVELREKLKDKKDSQYQEKLKEIKDSKKQK